jgi:hypothetical protein
VPIQGETIPLGDWRLRVLSLEGRRINQVRADRLPPPPAPEPVELPVANRTRSRRSGLDPAKLDPSRLDASNLGNSGVTNHP